MTITWNTLLSVAAIIAAIIALWGYLTKVVHFMDRQKKQDEEIAELRKHHDEDIKAIKEEQAVLCFGILACLKGLAEQGCDGSVHDAIETLDKHLNRKAHE